MSSQTQAILREQPWLDSDSFLDSIILVAIENDTSKRLVGGCDKDCGKERRYAKPIIAIKVLAWLSIPSLGSRDGASQSHNNRRA